MNLQVVQNRQKKMLPKIPTQTKDKEEEGEVDISTLDTLSKTTRSTGRGGQFFQFISLLPGNTYQLKELAVTSC